MSGYCAKRDWLMHIQCGHRFMKGPNSMNLIVFGHIGQETNWTTRSIIKRET